MPLLVLVLLIAGGVALGVGGIIGGLPAGTVPIDSRFMVVSPQPKDSTLKLGTFGFISPTMSTPEVLVDCGYPYVTVGNARTNITPKENEILRAFSPKIAHAGDRIIVWYSDEHNLSLGKKLAGYPFSDMTRFPSDFIDNPNIGDPNGTDGQGRPIYPAMFITDITLDPNSRIGDWQYQTTNQSAIPLHAIYGSWKALGENDSAQNVSGGTWDLAGLEQPPPGTPHQEWGAGAVWYVDKLLGAGKIAVGHTYRIQFMVHDGDQTNNGSGVREPDEGEGCATIQI